MFTKAIAKALVIVLTIGMTSLIGSPVSAMTFADSLTISATTSAQYLGETATANAPVVSATFLSTNIGDTYSVTTSLVSAPAGNVSLPVLRLIETASALVFTSSSSSPLQTYSVIQAGTVVKISSDGPFPLAVVARFNVYMDAPTKVGTYVVKITPAVLGGGGTLNATAQTLTITVTQPPSILADTMALSSPGMLQFLGETSSAYSSTLSASFLSTGLGDTYSVVTSLVSAPAGNVSLPILRLIETTSAVVYEENGTGPLNLNSQIQANTQARISPKNAGINAVSARFEIYLDAPTRAGTYVVKITPRILNPNGYAAATALTLTIVAGNTFPDTDVYDHVEYPQTNAPIELGPPETSTPETSTAYLTISSKRFGQMSGTREATSTVYLDLKSPMLNAGETVSVVAYLVSAPAGNVILPTLEYVQSTNARVDDVPVFVSQLQSGEYESGGAMYMSAINAVSMASSRFKIYMNAPMRAGTYVVKLIASFSNGNQFTQVSNLTVTIQVSPDPQTYPTSGDSIISRPGDISNKSDAEIRAPSTATFIAESAVIRTNLRNINGELLVNEAYTAIISGPGVLGSAPLAADINATWTGRRISVPAGNVVTVYGSGTAGEATIYILTSYGKLISKKTVTFVDLTNQASAILALSFSSFPEKGSLVTLTGLVNLPGTVRFTNNGKTLGSCARVAATGSPRTAVCQWKPPISGSINIVARFTPTDQGINAVTTTKVLAIGRRSGKR